MKLSEFPKQRRKAVTYSCKRLPFPPAFIRNVASAVHGPAKRLRRRVPFPAEAARPGRGEIFSLRRGDTPFQDRWLYRYTGPAFPGRLPKFMQQIWMEGTI